MSVVSLRLLPITCQMIELKEFTKQPVYLMALKESLLLAKTKGPRPHWIAGSDVA